jgi:hypothetical protein
MKFNLNHMRAGNNEKTIICLLSISISISISIRLVRSHILFDSYTSRGAELIKEIIIIIIIIIILYFLVLFCFNLCFMS